MPAPSLNPALVSAPAPTSTPAATGMPSATPAAATTGKDEPLATSGDQGWYVGRMMKNLEKYQKARDLSDRTKPATDA
ncbi:unnamed protein product [Pararhodospirillum photometricum DSM 122]|uniref:Uncharacterized protein n=1 Tax=Pararhodospirillum photometricum DSM 122 TaxID=1150469 RepID=H6SQ20_PARPM|nr:unnamed protein product [Pararhodospirillum photometricum DSM 122]